MARKTLNSLYLVGDDPKYVVELLHKAVGLLIIEEKDDLAASQENHPQMNLTHEDTDISLLESINTILHDDYHEFGGIW